MKTKTNYIPSVSLALSMQFILHLSSANAAVIITNSSETTPFPVSNSDLLQTSLSGPPVVTGNFTAFDTPGEPALRDGNDGGTSITDSLTTAIIATDSSVTYAFNVGANPLGYSIININTFGAWDDGRDRQKISIFYSTISDPSTFLTLAAYSFDLPNIKSFSHVGVMPEAGDPFLATAVHSIRFLFPDQESGGGGYRELDVIGQAVPEPSAIFLLGAAALACIATRKRPNTKEIMR